VWLIRHNPAYTPILGDEARILGKVLAVLRRSDDFTPSVALSAGTSRLSRDPSGGS
jgi:hypothetical protein